MNSTKRIAIRLAVAVAAASLTAGAIAPSSWAATTYTVKAGTTTTGTVKYTGTAANATLTDLTAGQAIVCQTATIGGTVTLGTGRAGSKLIPITRSSWNNCTVPVINSVVSGNVSGKTFFNGRTKTAAGVTGGVISPVAFGFSAPLLCTFTLTGAIDASYTNGTGTLTMKSVAGTGNTLSLTGVSGCLGVLKNGDQITFNAAYKTKTPLGKLTVTG